ncbi:hypothetical protein ACOMHN_007098 [Nucella lapillus]
MQRDDLEEALRLLEDADVATVVDYDVLVHKSDRRQVVSFLHRALNRSMRHGRGITCAKILMDLVVEAKEINTVSELISPQPSAGGLDEYYIPTPDSTTHDPATPVPLTSNPPTSNPPTSNPPTSDPLTPEYYIPTPDPLTTDLPTSNPTTSNLRIPHTLTPDRQTHPSSRMTPTYQERSSHLQVAASLGSKVLVEMLLDRGANLLNLDCPHSSAPVIILVRCSPPDLTLPALCTLPRGRSGPWRKAYTDRCNNYGLCALHYAVVRGLDEVFYFLINDCEASAEPWKVPYPGEDAPYPGGDVPYPGENVPYPGGNGPYPGGNGPYPGENGPYLGGNGPYPGGNGPYPGGNGPYSEGNGPYPKRNVPYPKRKVPYPREDAPYPGGDVPYPGRERQRGRFVAFSPMHMAVMRNNHYALYRLQSGGTDARLYLPILADSSKQRTVPHAVVLAHCECRCHFFMRYHIAPPAYISQQGVDFNPAVSLAAFLDDDASVTALVSAGANVNKRDSEGWTPLCIAVFWSNRRTVKTLLFLGADVDALPKHTGNLFHLTFSEHAQVECSRRHCKVLTINNALKLLLNTRAVDINARSADWSSPLMPACKQDYFMTVPLLVINGASLTSVDRCGRSALFYATVSAQVYRKRVMMRFLIDYGAACLEPNPSSPDGRLQTWRSLALVALQLLDTLSLFLLYRGGALRNRWLVSLLRQLHPVPRAEWLWTSLLYPFAISPESPVPGSGNHDANVSSRTTAGASVDHGQDSLPDSPEMPSYTDEEMEYLFGSDEADWRKLLAFCGFPEDLLALEQHDLSDLLTQYASSESRLTSPILQPRLMWLMYCFLHKISSTVPTLVDLCRWTVRDAIGDDWRARKRATMTLNVPASVKSQLMIGYRQTP